MRGKQTVSTKDAKVGDISCFEVGILTC